MANAVSLGLGVIICVVITLALDKDVNDSILGIGPVVEQILGLARVVRQRQGIAIAPLEQRFECGMVGTRHRFIPGTNGGGF